MKIEDMNPRQLDWCVAIALGQQPKMLHDYYRDKAALHGTDPTWHITVQPNVPITVKEGTTSLVPHYTSDWLQAGPIIEQEGITLRHGLSGWDAELDEFDILTSAFTPLVAAMRCFLISKFGEEYEIPGDST